MAPQRYRHPFKECWVRGWANRLHLRCMNLSLGAAAVLEGVASSLGDCGRQGCLSQRVRGEDCHEVTRINEGYWARIHGDDPRPAPNCCCRGCRGKGRGQKDDREGGCKCRNCRGLGLGLLIWEWGRRRRGAQSFALRSLFGVHMMSRMVVARMRLACEHGAELRSGLGNVCLGWDSAEHALWAMCALFLAFGCDSLRCCEFSFLVLFRDVFVLLRLPAHPGVVVLGVRRLRVAGLERMSRARQGIDCALAGSGRATTWVRLRSEGLRWLWPA